MSVRSAIKVLEGELNYLVAEQHELSMKVEAIERTLDHLRSLPQEKPNSQEVKDAVYEALQEIGQPLHREDIYSILTKSKGIVVNGQDPVNNLTAHMSNDARFAPAGNGFWALYEWRNTPAPSPVVVTESTGVDPEELPF